MGPTYIRVPRLGFRYSDNTVNWAMVRDVAWMSLLFVVVAGLVLGVVFWIDTNWLLVKPPKVVTKTVYISNLAAEEREFIKQCEASKKDISPNDINQPVIQGIPNTSVHPWVCQYGQ